MKQNYTSSLRRTLSAVLLLLLSTLAWAAPKSFFSDGILYTINEDGESVTLDGYYVDSCGVLVPSFYKAISDVVVPSTLVHRGKTYRVTSIEACAFNDYTSLTSISLPKGLTSIGSYAFKGCSSLASISLPEGLTSIGNGVFSGCSSLASISLPKGLTSIGSYAFKGCTSLASISLPEGLTSIGEGAFWDCTSLTSISLPKGLMSIGGWVFRDCTSLASIDFPEGLTDIGGSAFYGCRSLASISLPKGLTRIGQDAFNGCTALGTVVCRAEDVPVVCERVFGDSFWTAMLYVPASSLKAYKAADQWKNFAVILPLDDTETPSSSQ